jgi:hypothetical protein
MPNPTRSRRRPYASPNCRQETLELGRELDRWRPRTQQDYDSNRIAVESFQLERHHSAMRQFLRR